jgi:hypothetical protein
VDIEPAYTSADEDVVPDVTTTSRNAAILAAQSRLEAGVTAAR